MLTKLVYGRYRLLTTCLKEKIPNDKEILLTSPIQRGERSFVLAQYFESYLSGKILRVESNILFSVIRSLVKTKVKEEMRKEILSNQKVKSALQ